MTDARIVATNPVDSTVVPVACNEGGELLLDGSSLGQFVTKDGDTMTGNLHMGDKIILNPDGSAQFAGGAFDVYTDGKLEIGSTSITLDPAGTGSFSGDITAKNIEAANGALKVTWNGGDRMTIDSNGLIAYKNTSSDSNIAQWGNSNSASNIVFGAGGSASFASTVESGRLNVRANNVILSGYQSSDSKRVLFVDSSGNTQIGGDLTSTAGSNDPAIFLKPDGSALFTSDVVVGSRNKQWMLVESGGICHLVEQTFRDAILTADLADDPAAAAGEPSTYPALRNLPQEIDQLRSVVTALLTEVQRVEEKLRMAPESGWPVWDGSD